MADSLINGFDTNPNLLNQLNNYGRQIYSDFQPYRSVEDVKQNIDWFISNPGYDFLSGFHESRETEEQEEAA